MDHQFSNLFMNNNYEHNVSNDNNAGQFSDLPGFGNEMCQPVDDSSHRADAAAEAMPALPTMGSYGMNISRNFNSFAHGQPQSGNNSPMMPQANDTIVEDSSNAATSFDRSNMVPPSKVGIKFYSKNDVLCGRGGGTNVHPGNRRFRDLINANRRAYLKSKKNDKPAISRSIVRTIREMNGRFLKKDEKQGLWFEIGDDGAREKTSQALRQRAPEMRKILFEDEQRSQQAQQHDMLMQRQMMMNQGNMMGGLGGMNPMQMMGGPQGMNPMQMMMGGGMNNMGGGNQGSNNQGSNNNQDNQDNDNDSQGNNNNNSGNNDVSQSLMAKYNMLHQKNWLAQEKNMILQRLANMQGQGSGGDNGPGGNQQGNNFNPQALNNSLNNAQVDMLSDGPRGGTPRSA